MPAAPNTCLEHLESLAQRRSDARTSNEDCYKHLVLDGETVRTDRTVNKKWESRPGLRSPSLVHVPKLIL